MQAKACTVTCCFVCPSLPLKLAGKMGESVASSEGAVVAQEEDVGAAQITELVAALKAGLPTEIMKKCMTDPVRRPTCALPRRHERVRQHCERSLRACLGGALRLA